MKQRDLLELFALAAIWGASFLFTRIGAPQFGAVPLPPTPAADVVLLGPRRERTGRLRGVVVVRVHVGPPAIPG